MIITVRSRAALDSSPPRRVARRDRAEIALAWAISALLVIGLTWLAAGAGPAIHDMPDEVSAMTGRPGVGTTIEVPAVGTPGL